MTVKDSGILAWDKVETEGNQTIWQIGQQQFCSI